MVDRVVLRKDTAANWALANPVLGEGEIGYETDSKKYKMGDGVSTWNAMTYGLEINDVNHILKHNRGLEIEGAFTPAAPTVADSIILYNKSRAGRPCPIWRDDMNETYSVQPAFFGRNVAMLSAGNNTTVNQMGCLFTTVGTVSHPSLVGTTLANSMKMIRTTSSGATNSSAGFWHPQALVWRGTPGGIGGVPVGGFFLYVRFAITNNTAGSRCFYGLASGTAAAGTFIAPANHEPSAFPDVLGVGWDSTDVGANMFLYRRNGLGAVVKTEITVANGFNATATRALNMVYDFYIYCPPGGTTMEFRLVDEVVDVPCINNTSYTTDLPASNVMLGAYAFQNTGTGTAAVTADLNRLYLESDF